jgi:mannosyl-3-phosphoglycerate phosphatase
MAVALPLLVFTDLDGTLIAHDTYSWAAARPALEALHRLGAGLVMASSKTAPEIAVLRAAVGFSHWPAIVENGAGVLAAGCDDAGQGGHYRSLRAVLDALPARLRKHYRGFGDMTAQEIGRITGLPEATAKLAARRAFSEPGLWSGTQLLRTEFLQALARAGVSAREGGRFLTLSFGQTKADRMADVIAQYHPLHTVALGDAPNDVEMLQAADFGIIVANLHRAPLPVLAKETQGRILRTELAGPSGWNVAILDHIARLGLE